MVLALEIHGNQAVIVSITVMLCYESEPHWGHEKESQMTCNEPFGFFVVSIIGVLFLTTAGRGIHLARATGGVP